MRARRGAEAAFLVVHRPRSSNAAPLIRTPYAPAEVAHDVFRDVSFPLVRHAGMMCSAGIARAAAADCKIGNGRATGEAQSQPASHSVMGHSQ